MKQKNMSTSKIHREFWNAYMVALDFETLYEDGKYDKVVDIFSLCCRDETGKLIAHVYDVEYLPDLIELVMSGKKIIVHSAQFELKVLKNNGVDITKVNFEDTLIIAYLTLEETIRKKLKSLRVSVLKLPKREEYKDAQKLTRKEFIEYNRDDSVDCYLLFEKLYPRIIKEKLLTVYSLEKKVLFPVIEIETEGIVVDTKMREVQDEIISKYIKECIEFVERAAGKPTNLSSPKQIGELIYKILKVQPKESWKGKTGYSTSKSVLDDIQTIYGTQKPPTPENLHVAEVCRKIALHRKYSKLYTTFIGETMLNFVTEGRVHARFNPLGTSSGRFSCSSPNMQQIPRAPFDSTDPIRTHTRSLYVSPEGWSIITADYGQIEVFLAAEVSQDRVLKKVLLSGEDVHKKSAELIKSSDRTVGKSLNFSVLYGISAKGFVGYLYMTSKIVISEKEAQAYIDKYYRGYPELEDAFKYSHQFVAKYGYVSTFSGRKRRFNLQMQKLAYEAMAKGYRKANYNSIYRKAFNTIVQGSAADLMKVALCKIYDRIRRENLTQDIRLIMQVHDEVSAYVRDDKIEAGKKIIQEEMNYALKLSLPINTSMSSAKRWSENK